MFHELFFCSSTVEGLEMEFTDLEDDQISDISELKRVTQASVLIIQTLDLLVRVLEEVQALMFPLAILFIPPYMISAR